MKVLPMAILAMAALPAWGRIVVAYRLASPPLPVEAGQQFSVCAANVGATKVEIELQFVSVRTGAIVDRREVTIPPPGVGGVMPDPCLSTTADVVINAGNPPSGQQALLVALVVVRRGPFSRAAAATAAVQVSTHDPGGARRLVASIPLHLATMINNRNTPLETVR